MNAQAGPSRRLPSIPIDLSSIPLNKSRVSHSLSTTSIAPSLSTHRSSTQSTEGWGGLQTPRSERLSLSVSECSIAEDDVVVFGQGKHKAERSIDSMLLDDAQITGLWLDLDKTPKPSDPIFKAPNFPSRISSLPKQKPSHIAPHQKTITLPISPEQRAKPLPISPSTRLDKPLPLLSSPQIRTDKALPPAPLLHEIDELPPALPDDSPLIPPCMLERYVPPLHLIPAYDPYASRKKLAPPPTSLASSNVPVSHPTDVALLQPPSTETAAAGPPPPIPPRRSSRRVRSGQSVPIDKKMVSSTSLVSLSGQAERPVSSTSSASLASITEAKVIPSTSTTSSISLVPATERTSSSTSLMSLGQAPPLPPPRASSLRSASARAANSAAASTDVIIIPGPTKTIGLKNEPPQSPLTRQPRVRSRSAQLPPPPPKPTIINREPSQSYISLTSILEDEAIPDMDSTPEGSWALRRKRLRLARAKSQPKLRGKMEYGPWRPLKMMPSRRTSVDLI